MLADLDTLTSSYTLDETGIDGSNKLIDAGPLAQGLALGGSGGPVWRDVDGVQCADFDGSWWWHGRCPWLVGGSVAMLFAIDIAGGPDGVLHPVSTIRTGDTLAGVSEDGDTSAVTPSDWLGSSSRDAGFQFFGMSVRPNAMRAGAPAYPSLPTVQRGALQLVIARFGLGELHTTAALNDGAPTDGSDATSASNAVPLSAFMRIGQTRATPAAPSGFVCVKRLWTFRGDVFAHPDFDVARADELTARGIV